MFFRFILPFKLFFKVCTTMKLVIIVSIAFSWQKYWKLDLTTFITNDHHISMTIKHDHYQLSIACWTKSWLPHWLYTLALPKSSSIAKTSGATLAQFLQPAKINRLLTTLQISLLRSSKEWIQLLLPSKEYFIFLVKLMS